MKQDKFKTHAIEKEFTVSSYITEEKDLIDMVTMTINGQTINKPLVVKYPKGFLSDFCVYFSNLARTKAIPIIYTARYDTTWDSEKILAYNCPIAKFKSIKLAGNIIRVTLTTKDLWLIKRLDKEYKDGYWNKNFSPEMVFNFAINDRWKIETVSPAKINHGTGYKELPSLVYLNDSNADLSTTPWIKIMNGKERRRDILSAILKKRG